ncbi:MAG: hypothetical protein KBA40_01400 [Candidatus Peribacteraceae bacterium]|nr:hypothetical protein [Candidatus Peribacteraceae bacterium]MBP9850612.1 hypothetical protein [Candidatus Peribacteraceae bacterium]
MDTALTSKPTTNEKIFLVASAVMLVTSLAYAYSTNQTRGSLIASGCTAGYHLVDESCIKN